MANERIEYIFGVRKLKPWKKPGVEKSLREILEHPDPTPKYHQPTVMTPDPFTARNKDLCMWQRLHYITLFNPHGVVKESDLYPALPVDHSPPLPRAHPVPYPCHRWTQLPAYFMFHIFRIGRALLDYNLPQTFAPEEDILAGNVRPSSPVLFPWYDSEISIPYRPSATISNNSNRALLRCPVPQPPRPLTPALHSYQSRLSLHNVDLKVYTNFSLTTLDDKVNDPLDENCFYRTHFPLCLKSIPCREERGRPGPSKAYLYRVMHHRPISNTLFDTHKSRISTPSSGSLLRWSSSSTMLPSFIRSSASDSEDDV